MKMTKTIMIEQYLKKIVFSHALDYNFKLPSENSLCLKFNVSKITVKNAINILEKNGLIYKYQGKGIFISPNADKCIINHGTTQNIIIGVILPDLESNFMLNILNGIQRTLSQRNVLILIECSYNDAITEQRSIIKLSELISGLIIYPADNQELNQGLLNFKLTQKPVVLIDRHLPSLNVSSVQSNHLSDVYNATNYLIQNGHTNIGIISSIPSGTSTLNERIEGYKKALRENKISIIKKHLLIDLDNYNKQSFQRIEDFIKQNKKMTSIICLNSNWGLNTLKILNKLNIKVPEKISLITYEDDFSNYVDILGKPITGIQQQTFTLGEKAANIIMDNLTGINTQNKHLFINSKLNIRKTT